MKLLCASSNLGYLISLDIALQAEGIPTYLSDADRMTAGLAGAMVSAGRLYLLDEDDFERAVRIAQALDDKTDAEPDEEPATQTTQTHRKPSRRWAVFSAIAAAVLMLAFLLTQ